MKAENEHEISNNFANIFNDEGDNIIHNFRITTTCVDNSLYFRYVTVSEMSSILSKLNISKGPGPDKIKSKNFKNTVIFLV